MHGTHTHPLLLFPGICLASYKGLFQTHAGMDVAYDVSQNSSSPSASVLPTIGGGQGHQEGATSSQFAKDYGSSRGETESGLRLSKFIWK